MTTTHSEVTTKCSAWSVGETVQRLLETLDERGMTVFATIDQRAEARRVGLQLRETILIIFGNPIAGTPVMELVPLAALDLPLKLLIWADAGRTSVSYLDPTALAARHALPDSVAGPLAGIDGLTDAALQCSPDPHRPPGDSA